MVWSADQGSSSVMWTRLRRLATRRSAWSEIPDEAASEMTATSFLPAMKASFSCRLIFSMATWRRDRDRVRGTRDRGRGREGYVG